MWTIGSKASDLNANKHEFLETRDSMYFLGNIRYIIYIRLNSHEYA
jgi:hypothetical protein